MQMKDRIKEIQEYVQMSQQDFAACLEISAATLSGIYNGRSQPTIKTANAIHSSFPEINTDWLMFGTGDMFVDGKKEKTEKIDVVPSVPQKDSVSVTPAIEPEASASAQVSASGPQIAGMMFPSESEPYAQPSSQPRRNTSSQRREQQSIGRGSQGYINNGKYIDNVQRRIKEIRVFFDDGTYESFVPSSK